MRLMSFSAGGKSSWGVVEGDSVIDMGARAPSVAGGAAAAPGADADSTEGLPRHELAEVTFLPPIPDPDKIICVGLNYLTHILEGGREPEAADHLHALANSQIGHDQPIIRPQASETLDFEGELAVRHRQDAAAT